MNKASLVILVMLLCVTASAGEKQSFKEFRTKMQTERKEFQASLKDIPTENRKEAVKEFKDKQYQERKAELEKRVSADAKLTDEQKANILKKAEDRHAETQSFVASVNSSTTLTKEQKKAEIKEYLKARKEKGKKTLKELKEQALEETATPDTTVQ